MDTIKKTMAYIMIKGILIQLLFLVSIPTFSQQKITNKNIKELKETIKGVISQDDTISLVNSLNSLGEIYAKINTDSTFFYSDLALRYSNKIKYKKGIAYAKLNRSLAFYYEDEYLKSLKEIQEIFPIATTLNDLFLYSEMYNNLGLIYMHQEFFSQAEKEFEKALKLSIYNKDRSNQLIHYFNLGVCHLLMFEKHFYVEDLDIAKKYLQISLKISTEMDDRLFLTMANCRLGDVANYQGKFKTAIQHYNYVFTNYQPVALSEFDFALSGVALSFLGIKNFDKAIRFGEAGLAKASGNKGLYHLKRSHNALYRIYKKIGQFEKSLFHLEKKNLYIQKIELKNEANFLTKKQLQYKIIENNYLDKINDLRKRELNNQFLIICFISIILFLTSITLFILYKSNQYKTALNKTLIQQNEIIKNQREFLQKGNNTKNKLFSILGHDLREPFSMINYGLNLIEDDTIEKSEKSFIISRFRDQVTNVFNLLNNLLFWSQNQLGEIKIRKENIRISPFLNSSIKEILSIKNSKLISINLNDQILKDTAIFADPNHLSIIIRNVISNSIKFSEIKGIIEIQLVEFEGKIILKIIDYGVGMNIQNLTHALSLNNIISKNGTSGEKGYGLGLQLVLEFCKLNSISVDIKSELGKGTSFEFQFNKVT